MLGKGVNIVIFHVVVEIHSRPAGTLTHRL